MIMENQLRGETHSRPRAARHAQTFSAELSARTAPSLRDVSKLSGSISGKRPKQIQTTVTSSRDMYRGRCVADESSFQQVCQKSLFDYEGIGNDSVKSADHALAEWLWSLGWRERLSPSDLRKLNTPKMQSIWRHLQTHVVPVDVANTVRKNVLLKRLEEKNIDGKFGKFKLDSINQLSKVEEVMKKEEEKEKIIQEIKKVDAKLQVANSTLLLKNSIVERERIELGEIENKTMILGLKRDQLLRECKKYNDLNETILYFIKPKNTIPLSELSRQKALVYKYVKDYKYPLNDSHDDSEYLCEVMASIMGFKPGAILDGISKSAKEALINLTNTKFDINAIVKDRMHSKEIVTVEEKLRELKILINQMELQIQAYKSNIKSELDELEKEKVELLEGVEKSELDRKKSNESESYESDDKNSHEGRMEDIGKDDCSEQCLSQLLNTFLINIKEERKNKVIEEKTNQLIANECLESIGDWKQSVNSLSKKKDEIWKEVKKKESEINTLISTLFSEMGYSIELNKLTKQVYQLASEFKTETSQVNEEKIGISELSEFILKEIEVFFRTSQVVLQRKWDCSRDVLSIHSNKQLSNNSALVHLLQKEGKNAIVDILKILLWSKHSCPQQCLV